MMTRPTVTTCPQCSSLECGPTTCRFSGITHRRARELDQENRYAEAGIRRDIAMRYTGRPDHDTGPAGQKTKG